MDSEENLKKKSNPSFYNVFTAQFVRKLLDPAQPSSAMVRLTYGHVQSLNSGLNDTSNTGLNKLSTDQYNRDPGRQAGKLGVMRPF